MAERLKSGAMESRLGHFFMIDECLEGTIQLMRSDWTGPVNIGSARISHIEVAHLLLI